MGLFDAYKKKDISIERAYIEHFETKTASPGQKIDENDIKTAGNRNKGFDTKSPTREAKRQKYFNDAYKQKKKALDALKKKTGVYK